MSLSSIKSKNAAISLCGKNAVVVGATSGIGRGIAIRLAEAGANTTIVGRDATRGQQILDELKLKSPSANHQFIACDAQLLSNTASFASTYKQRADKLDILVLSQGIATLQGYTPTSEGIDQKLAIHYYGRMTFIDQLLPLLQSSSNQQPPFTPRVLSVLSGNAHFPYAGYKEDPEVKSTFSIKNAADAAGFYNNLSLEALAREQEGKIEFAHFGPGFVSTNWGTEMPWLIRKLCRLVQHFGRSPADCAEYAFHGLFTNTTVAEDKDALPDSGVKGFKILNENGVVLPKKKEATDEARESVWSHTKTVLQRVLGSSSSIQ